MRSSSRSIFRLIGVLCLSLIGLMSAQAQSSSDNTPGESSKGLVLVAGATGGTGKEIVKHLLDNGFEVRAMVRNEAKARVLFGDDVTYVVADVRQPDQLIEAMTGARYVAVAIGSTRGDPDNSPKFVDFGGVRNLADVAAALNIQQLVLVSSAGVTDEDHFLNRMFDNVLNWKLKGENALRASGVPYTIVRPGGLVNKPGGQDKIVFAQGDTTSGTISRDDVAMICVAALLTPEAVDKTFEAYSESGTPSGNWQALFAALTAN
ncbi:MAG: SDR family oxidoreductase [Chromatiales bacterium]|jgi:uncharacterized protein YbjT (DUF2867 family)|nr:SDR family oxidoreductase [Chromatiales bacterium]